REGIVLPNILFKLGLAELLPTSFNTLNRLRQELLQNPGVKIELHGHTDNVGDRQMNQSLSESRASAVRQYLIENGIKGERIGTKGFGPDKPITDNSSEAARQKNRRVELVVIEGR
ncbi:MAG: OmpA family protein, partial [Spirochaetia bacterium]|nr:OmpA family protein [Spirochaetia bacterium]